MTVPRESAPLLVPQACSMVLTAHRIRGAHGRQAVRMPTHLAGARNGKKGGGPDFKGFVWQTWNDDQNRASEAEFPLLTF